MHILHVVGARPNFMKAAPVLAALGKKAGVQQTLVHTGQHYDANMSDVFFHQLGMPIPDVNLEVGAGSHAQQTAQVISRFETVVSEQAPDLTLVYGDVNSTMAAALVCSKLQIKVGHVEAGLRSRDRGMPEEINRLIADQLADLLFTPSPDGDENLCREGITPAKIHRVGNVMIDTLVRLLPICSAHKPAGLPDRYALVTLHRPSNVDDPVWLKSLLLALEEIAKELQVVFPIHPRTRKRIDELGLKASQRVQLLDPAPYLTFLALQKDASIVITDSGGVQEETTFLGIPCLTLRENTERPITVTLGTNLIIGRDLERMQREVHRILSGEKKASSPIPLWDGHAAERIAQVVLSAL
ncbi:MAG TPA: UDP-N-acetylglucosamine 2-epimerase (non-hydrolyzing) [Terriglobales bacterium]|nr:UDP-N-acetylglucosamine 2-epimerase (non-hydrolyzing) [Terriglobales bacterium]